jgi:hypothetical protein
MAAGGRKRRPRTRLKSVEGGWGLQDAVEVGAGTPYVENISRKPYCVMTYFTVATLPWISIPALVVGSDMKTGWTCTLRVQQR